MKALTRLWSDMTKPQEELASQEVKLSAVERLEDIIDSMRSAKDEIETAVSDFDQYMDRAYGAYLDMKEASDNANYGMNELDEEIDFVEKAAETLGIDVPAVKEGRRVMQDVESAYADAEERIRKYDL
jgi:hypothetical protein